MRQGIREVKETAILIKSTFSNLLFLGRSLVRLWFFLGLLPERDWDGTREGNLKNRTILDKMYLLLFAQLAELLQELRIGFANAGGVVHFVACN